MIAGSGIADGRAGRRLPRRRRRSALARQRSRALGRHRGAGLAVPSRLRGGDARACCTARSPTRSCCATRPTASTIEEYPDYPIPPLREVIDDYLRGRAADQPRHPLRGRQHQFLHARRRRVARATGRGSSASWGCRSATRCAAASMRSPRRCWPHDRGRDRDRALGTDRAVRHGARLRSRTCRCSSCTLTGAGGRAGLGRGRRRRLRRRDARIDGARRSSPCAARCTTG